VSEFIRTEILNQYGNVKTTFVLFCLELSAIVAALIITHHRQSAMPPVVKKIVEVIRVYCHPIRRTSTAFIVYLITVNTIIPWAKYGQRRVSMVRTAL
jgi:hypothetical protein